MKFRKIVLLIPLLLLVLTLVAGSSLLWRLFIVSALALAVSFLWALFGSRGISVTIDEPPRHSQVGEKIIRSVTATNSSRFASLFVKAEEISTMPDYQNSRLLNLKGRETQRWQNILTCTHRGLYNLGTVRVTSGDPFGLFSKSVRMGESSKLIVYPRIIDLPLFKTVSLNDFGYTTGFQSISQMSPNASSVREFMSGDSLHHIHWHSVAHTGRLMVKMFDADRAYNSSKTFWLALDMEAKTQAGKSDDSTEEYAVTIAASLIRHHLENGMRVGMITEGDRAPVFSPARGEQYLWGMLEALATIRAQGSTPLGQLIFQHIDEFKDDPVIIIIATSNSGQLVESIRRLKTRVESVVVILLDSPSFGEKREAINTAQNLTFSGAQVYVVKQGDELSKALDSRVSIWQARYG